MKAATEILLSAAFVLTPEENLARRALARDGSGGEVYTYSPEACRFCMSGAIIEAAIALRLQPDGAWDALDKVGVSIAPDFNDSHTHAEVLQALYRAAELSEQS